MIKVCQGGGSIVNVEYLEYSQACTEIYNDIKNNSILSCESPNKTWMQDVYSLVSSTQTEEYAEAKDAMSRIIRAYLCVGLGAGDLITSKDNATVFYDKVLEVKYPAQDSTLFKINKSGSHLYVYVDDNSMSDMHVFADFNIHENGGYDFVSVAISKDGNGVDVAIGDSELNFVEITTYMQDFRILVYNGTTGYMSSDADMLNNGIIADKFQEGEELLKSNMAVINQLSTSIDFSYDYAFIEAAAKKYFPDSTTGGDEDPDDQKTYTVKIYVDGEEYGTFDRAGNEWLDKIEELNSYYGEEFLDGWYSDSNKSQKINLNNIDRNGKENLSLYAFISDKVSVVFSDEYGNELSSFIMSKIDKMEIIWDRIPSITQKEGYEGKFVSEYTQEEISRDDEAGVNDRYYLLYTPITYQVIYHNLTEEEIESLELPTSRTVESGESLPHKNYVRVGYTFEGFYTQNEGGQKIESIPAGIGDFHVYIRLTPLEYKIQYIGAEESVNTNKTTFTVEDEPFELQPLSSDIWQEFLGWKYEPSEESDYITSINPAEYHNNLYIYAMWDYSKYNLELVDFDNNLYSCEYKLSKGYVQKYDFEFNSDKGIYVLTLKSPNINKIGYNFESWINVDSGAKIIEITENDLIKGRTIRIKPTFSLIEYKITYLDLFETEVENPTTYNVEDNITLTPPIGNRPGYSFDYWIDGNITIDTDNPIVDCTKGGDKTITACWKVNTYTIKLHVLIGDVASDKTINNSYYYTEAKDLTTYNINECNYSLDLTQNNSLYGYKYNLIDYLSNEFTFLGFKVNNNFECSNNITTEQEFNNLLINKEGQIVSAITKDMIGDIELWPVYEIKNYTVSYMNSATNTQASISESLPTTINCFTPLFDLSTSDTYSTDTRAGYTNTGWRIDYGIYSYDYINGRTIDYEVGGIITVNISWRVITYCITYWKCSNYWNKLSSNKEYTSSPRYYNVEDDAFDLSSPEELEPYSVNMGYNFIGWTTAPDGAGEKISKITPGERENEYHSNIDVYDCWEEKNVTITYHFNDGSENEKTFTQTAGYHNFIITTPIDMRTREGYLFHSWGETRDANIPVYIDSIEGKKWWFSNNEDTLDLYAIWDLEIEYELQEDNTFTLTHLRIKDNGEWTIPQTATVNGVTAPVTAIGDNAFTYAKISKLYMKDSNIKVLENNALNGNYENLVIDGLPNKLERLGSGNLQNVKLISGDKIIIPSTLKTLGSYAFDNCNLEIDFSSATFTQIGASVFSDYKFETLIIPDCVKEINVKAFNLSNITELKLPKDVEMIQTSSEDKMDISKLLRLTSSSNVLKYFKDYSVENAKLKEIILLDTDNLSNDWSTIGFFQAVEKVDINKFTGTEIPNNMFKNLYLLDNVYLPKTITKIGESAFENCFCLTNLSTIEQTRPLKNAAILDGYQVDLPNGILELGSKAFANCVSIKGIRVGKSIKVIGEGAFSGCASVETLRLQYIGKTRDSRNLETTVDNYKEAYMLWVFGTMIPEKFVIKPGDKTVFDTKKVGDIAIKDIVTYMYAGDGRGAEYFHFTDRDLRFITPNVLNIVIFESEIDSIASYSLRTNIKVEFEAGIKGTIKSYGLKIVDWDENTMAYDFTKITRLEDYAIEGDYYDVIYNKAIVRDIKLDASKLEYIGDYAFNNYCGNIEFINSRKDSTHTIITGHKVQTSSDSNSAIGSGWLSGYMGYSIEIPYEIDEFREKMLSSCYVREITFPRTTILRNGTEIFRLSTLADPIYNELGKHVTKITIKSGIIKENLFRDIFGGYKAQVDKVNEERETNNANYLDIVLGEDVTTIWGSGAFRLYDMTISTGLRYITFENPNTILQFDAYIFDYLDKSQLVLENHIYYLGTTAVGVNLTKADESSDEVDAITTLTFRSGTTVIGNLFGNYELSKTITAIYLPGSVQNVSIALFDEGINILSGLQEIYFAGTKAAWKAIMAKTFANEKYEVKDLNALSSVSLQDRAITLHYYISEQDKTYTAIFTYNKTSGSLE